MRKALIERISSKQESTRVAYAKTLLTLMDEDPRIVMVSPDSVLAFRTTQVLEKYPDRVVEVGIAEQNAVGCAAGLASAGCIPFVGAYAGFLTMRACEQMRTFVGYTQLGVIFLGANAGIYAGEREGTTHQFIEDLGILRTVPGFTVIAPADAGQTRQAVRAAAAIGGPVYIRIGSGRDPVVFETDVPFELGKARILAEYGTDCAVIGCGHLLPRALMAASILAERGVKVTVAEVHTLKPLDVKGITELLTRCGRAVTVEDHNIIGGLGSAVCEAAAEHCPVPVLRVGVRDRYAESGPAEALADAYGMSVDDIVRSVFSVIGE